MLLSYLIWYGALSVCIKYLTPSRYGWEINQIHEGKITVTRKASKQTGLVQCATCYGVIAVTERLINRQLLAATTPTCLVCDCIPIRMSVCGVSEQCGVPVDVSL